MEVSETHGEKGDRTGNEQAGSAKICDQDRVMDTLPKERIWWSFTLFMLIEHLYVLHACKLLLQGRFLWSTVAFGLTIGYAGAFAVTVGAHRLFAHRSFKAKWPLRLLLAILQVLGSQGSLWHWVAWHRAHHKHSETRLDPHNATRGFFYAHVGWLLTYDPKRFRTQLEKINMDDMDADPIVMWQDRNYSLLTAVMNALAVAIPHYYFGENRLTAFAMCHSARVVITWHATFLVNSAAHLYGYKPYDKNIYPAENKLVSFVALGEGWHNYHHTFPWDYRTSEYGGFYRFNPSAALIECFAKMGWAYDLKAASPELLASRADRTGMASANDSTNGERLLFL